MKWNINTILLIFVLFATGNVVAHSQNNSNGKTKYYYQPQLTPTWTLPNFETPSWSPDGDKIAFQLINKDGIAQVWIMDADGDNKQPITDISSNNAQPSWLQAKDRMVFISDRTGHREVFLMNSDGSEQTQ